MRTIEHIANLPAIGKMLCCPYIGTNYCMNICEKWDEDRGGELCNFLCSECDRYKEGCSCTKDLLPRSIPIPKSDTLPPLMLESYRSAQTIIWLLYDPNLSPIISTHEFIDHYGAPPEATFLVHDWGIFVMGPCPWDIEEP